MKKLLCIALFGVAIMVNANNSKEIDNNNFNEIRVENSDFEKEIKTENNHSDKTKIQIIENVTLVGCGSQANAVYDELIAAGMSHSEAREQRRIWVRDCRGNGPNGWLGICFSFLHGCDRN